MFRGSIVALVTPMLTDEKIDFTAFERLLAWHIESKTAAIVIAGTTGESATLTAKERQQLLQMAIKYVAHRVPIIAGTGHPGTAATIEETRMAMEAGADACLLMAPPYIKPTQEGLFRHYQATAKAVPIPQILYNVPGRTVSDILPETVARLASIPNIIGIKEATGNIDRVDAILKTCGDNIDIYSGDDATFLQAMRAGAKGVISVTANVAPAMVQDICASMLDGDYMVATTLDRRLQALHQDLFLEANPIPVKWALQQMGWIGEGIRLPLTYLSEQHHRRVLAAMQKAAINTQAEPVYSK